MNIEELNWGRYSSAGSTTQRDTILNLQKEKANCCGCSACYAICPVHAISMVQDEEGFLYPSVNAEKCVQCHRCISVCSFILDQGDKKRRKQGVNVTCSYSEKQWNHPRAYAVKHRDANVLMESRSGGVFTALSDATLKKSGTVYGCVLDQEFRAIHVRAESKNERNRMRGSKYIQSDTRGIFTEVQKDLKDGREVLFSGTSCQIAAIRSFLGRDYSNLLCVDIVCHGVPSPLLWKSYLHWQETKHNRKINSVEFRNKKVFGWADHVESLRFDNGKQLDSRIFSKLFYGHCALRPSCYDCPYKDTIHPGDITIADYWGIGEVSAEFDDNRGTSLVLINNDKGKSIFDSVCNQLNYIETRVEDCIQEPLKKSCDEPKNRSEWWKDFQTIGFDGIVRKYVSNTFVCDIKLRIKRLYALLSDLLRLS